MEACNLGRINKWKPVVRIDRELFEEIMSMGGEDWGENQVLFKNKYKKIKTRGVLDEITF